MAFKKRKVKSQNMKYQEINFNTEKERKKRHNRRHNSKKVVKENRRQISIKLFK